MRRLGLAVVLALVATGCASTASRTPMKRPGVDVSGHWTGRWFGYGIVDIPREEDVTADLTQNGRRGYGLLVLDGVNAAEEVPISLRRAGSTGVRVMLRVSGSNVVIEHEEGGELFIADMKVKGDRMTGVVRGSDPAVRLVLVRAREEALQVPESPPVPPPAAPAAESAAPEPPKALPEVAAAPPPPPRPEPTPESKPAPARPAPTGFQAAAELKPLYFDFDKADIRSEDIPTLDASAKWLTDHPESQMLIEGHADERGTNEYNLALGERRARTARDYLITHGLSADRVSTVSYGEERPVCTEKNDACWTLNRRVEFLVKPQ